MRHLDDRISDFVDNRLDDDERDRVLAHLASCPECRTTAETERAAKGALGSLRDIEPPSSLTSKLMALAEPGEPLPAEQPAAMAHAAPWLPSGPPEAARNPGGATAAVLPEQSRPPFVDRHRRGVRLAAGGMVSTGAVLMLLASLGAPATPGRDQTPASVVPPMEQFTVEYARSTSGLPFGEPAAILVPAVTGPTPAATSPAVDPRDSGNGW